MPAKKRNGRGGARVGAGRKPKPETERRSETVSTKLTKGERADLEGAAKGESLSDYVRRLVIRHLARKRK